MSFRYVLLFSDGSFSGFTTRADVERSVGPDNRYHAHRAKIPADAVPISEEAYQDFMSNQTARRWDGNARRFVPID